MGIPSLEQLFQRKDVPSDVKEIIKEFITEYEKLESQLKITMED